MADKEAGRMKPAAQAATRKPMAAEPRLRFESLWQRKKEEWKKTWKYVNWENAKMPKTLMKYDDCVLQYAVIAERAHL